MKNAIIGFCIIIVLLLLISITNYNLVFHISSFKSQNLELTRGEIVNPLKQFDLSKGKWEAYLVLSRNDFANLNPSISKARCLKTNDIKVIGKMKEEWNFIYREADVSTVESSIYILNDNKLVFVSGIILDKDKQGLQNRTYGWIEPIKQNVMVESFKEFKKVYWPIIFL